MRGVNEPLSKVPCHSEAPITRLSMLNSGTIKEADMHIAVHFVNSKDKSFPTYSEPHRHNVDEINLILSEDDNLIYEITLEDETYDVTSPSTVYIPKGVTHSAQVKSGKGIFVCIIMSSKYETYS